MQRENIMNVLLYDMSQRRTPKEILSTGGIISEIIDGWANNKYVFPQHHVKFRHRQNKTYRLM